MKLLQSLILVVLLVAVPSSISFSQEESSAIRSYVESNEKDKDLVYYQQAVTLKELLAKQNIPVTTEVVVKMLKAIDHDIPKFYPKGPFTRNDFIALAWLESAFHQYEKGTHGECGLFQIMPDEFADWQVKKNFYNININTIMAFRVLNGKYVKWHDYKKAIQAYNGIIRLKNGKWSEKYWKAFEKRRVIVGTLFNS
jgi:Transglycosylase SLT domain